MNPKTEFLNMKGKKNSEEVSEQLLPTDFDLTDDCWQLILKFLKNEEKRYSCESLSLVSKQFLSITNRFHNSLTIYEPTLHFLPRLLQRFTNLTSIDFSWLSCDLDKLLGQISCFPLKITSLNISNQPDFPTNGLRTFSKSIKTLTSLTCSNIDFDYNYGFFHIADCFPLLQILDLSGATRSHLVHSSLHRIYFEFSNLEALDLYQLCRIHFEFPKLEVLDLSHTTVDDEELYIISKACHRLLQLSMNVCLRLTEKGVKHVLGNCTQLREINIARCHKVNPSIVASMVFSRPSLRKITAPPGCILSDAEKKLFKLQGCIVC